MDCQTDRVIPYKTFSNTLLNSLPTEMGSDTDGILVPGVDRIKVPSLLSSCASHRHYTYLYEVAITIYRRQGLGDFWWVGTVGSGMVSLEDLEGRRTGDPGTSVTPTTDTTEFNTYKECSTDGGHTQGVSLSRSCPGSRVVHEPLTVFDLDTLRRAPTTPRPSVPRVGPNPDERRRVWVISLGRDPSSSFLDGPVSSDPFLSLSGQDDPPNPGCPQGPFTTTEAVSDPCTPTQTGPGRRPLYPSHLLPHVPLPPRRPGGVCRLRRDHRNTPTTKHRTRSQNSVEMTLRQPPTPVVRLLGSV